MLVCKQNIRRNQPLNLSSPESSEIILQTLEEFHLIEEFRNNKTMTLKVNSNIFTVLRKKLCMNLKDKFKEKQVRLLNYHINRLVPSKDVGRRQENAATDSLQTLGTTQHLPVETAKADNKAENDSIADSNTNDNMIIHQKMELLGAYHVNMSDVSIINNIDFENKVIFDNRSQTSMNDATQNNPHSIELPDTSDVVMTDVPILYDIDFGDLSLVEENETLPLAKNVSVRENNQPKKCGSNRSR